MGMSLYVTVPISTEVIELNPDCAFSTAYEDGVLMITVDTRLSERSPALGAEHQDPAALGQGQPL
jgi:hypothetical protein